MTPIIAAARACTAEIERRHVGPRQMIPGDLCAIPTDAPHGASLSHPRRIAAGGGFLFSGADSRRIAGVAAQLPETRTSSAPAAQKGARISGRRISHTFVDEHHLYSGSTIYEGPMLGADLSTSPDMTVFTAPCGCSQLITGNVTTYRYCAAHGRGRVAAIETRR